MTSTLGSNISEFMIPLGLLGKSQNSLGWRVEHFFLDLLLIILQYNEYIIVIKFKVPERLLKGTFYRGRSIVCSFGLSYTK